MSTKRDKIKQVRGLTKLNPVGECSKTAVKVEIFTFCKYAAQINGALDLNGTFDVLEVRDFPVRLQQFCIVLRLRLPKTNPFAQCELLLINPEGDLLFRPTKIEVRGATANFIFANRNAQLTRAGIYHAVLRENQMVVASLPLFVNQIGQPKFLN